MFRGMAAIIMILMLILYLRIMFWLSFTFVVAPYGRHDASILNSLLSSPATSHEFMRFESVRIPQRLSANTLNQKRDNVMD